MKERLYFLLKCALDSLFAEQEPARIVLYALIPASQILFSVLVLRPAAGSGQLFTLCRLSGVLIVLAPFSSGSFDAAPWSREPSSGRIF